jgi:sulfoxide reductase catalytic subunit YedY
LPNLSPTDEKHYLSRRRFIKVAAVVGTAAAATAVGYAISPLRPDHAAVLRPGLERPKIRGLFPAVRNAAYNLEQSLTDEMVAATHNNFYEFTTNKGKVWELARNFAVDPWTIEVTGLCAKPRRFGIDELFKLPAVQPEERTYRFRCVEAWAMDVPWTGFELGRLLKLVEPKSDARYVRFVSLERPAEMPGIARQPGYPWPYFEALRMDEAMQKLTLVATGIYGRPLPRQFGAPFRIIVPWKYGYKSPKSIVKIELTAKRPLTFWNKLAPREYGFLSNVDPKVPHPRWSQASEKMIGSGERRPTLPYNGYAAQVAQLYA